MATTGEMYHLPATSRPRRRASGAERLSDGLVSLSSLPTPHAPASLRFTQRKKAQEKHATVPVPCRPARPRAGGTGPRDAAVPQCWGAENSNTQSWLRAHCFLTMWKRKSFAPKEKEKKNSTHFLCPCRCVTLT